MKVALFFILSVTVSILFHEFGHCLIAKLFHIPVTEFAFGNGKILFEKQGKSETKYTFRILPIGGFCTMDDAQFDALPRWKRAVILVAGCVNNLVLGLVPLALCFVADGKGLGAALVTYGSMIVTMITGLGKIFSISLHEIAGPVGTVNAISNFVSSVDPAAYVVALCLVHAMLNILLAIFNLIPFPGLDGGQILILGLDRLVEWFTGKGLDKKYITALNVGGVFIMTVLSLLAFTADLWVPLVS